MRWIPSRSPTLGLAVLGLAACTPAPATDPRMVSEWMHTLYGAIRAERLSPPVASRLMAYATTALYSGLSSTERGMPALSGQLNGLGKIPAPEDRQGYDPTLTAVVAERVVLDSLLREALPTTRASIARLSDSLLQVQLSRGASERTVTRSRELGAKIGNTIVAWSRGDGFDSTRGRPYTAPTGLAYWVNDAPANVYASQNQSGASEFVALNNPASVMQAGAVSDRSLILSRPKRKVATLPAVNMAGTSEPYWGQIRPFVLRSWDECAAPPPPDYSADTSSARYRDAHDVLAAKTSLTPEQKEIALYWADNAGESGTPVGHWVAIGAQMVSERHLSAEDAARLMVLTSVAQADAFISSWGYKYKYNLIRPRTYIRRLMDSTWEPLIPTPPFPEYPSGHSTVSAAAAEVMTALLGDTSFEDSTSIVIGHEVRRFDSFRAAASEAGISRIYGGIHFPTGNVGGRTLGECIGTKVVERFKAAHKS